MNIIFLVVSLYALSTTKTTTAEERYPSLVVERNYTPIFPRLIKPVYQSTDLAAAYGFTYTGDVIAYYFYCPARSADEESRNVASSSKNAMFCRERKERGQFSLLDEPLPTCESPVRATIRKIKGEKKLYEMGFMMHMEPHEDPHIQEVRNLFKQTSTFEKLINFNFNESTKTIISVEYTRYPTAIMRIASNKADMIAFDENLELLGNSVNRRYEHFRKNLLPKMIEEQSSNALAHALGIQKVSLAPKDDFAADAWKTATYADAITAPIWRILLLKWNAVEIFVRKAVRFDVLSQIINGVSGTSNTVQKYYADGDREIALQVPHYVWKVVSPSKHNEEAVLIVMHNDPFYPTERHSCAESCTQYGWPIDNDDYRTGLIYCCELKSSVAVHFGVISEVRKPEMMDMTNSRHFKFLIGALTNYSHYSKVLDW